MKKWLFAYSLLFGPQNKQIAWKKPRRYQKKWMPMVNVLSIADALCQIFETSFGDKAHILNMVKKVRKKKGKNLAHQ